MSHERPSLLVGVNSFAKGCAASPRKPEGRAYAPVGE